MTTLVVKVLPTRQRGISLALVREVPLPLERKTRAQKRKESTVMPEPVTCLLAILFIRCTEEKTLLAFSLSVIKWLTVLPSIIAKSAKWTILAFYTKGSSGNLELLLRFLTQYMTLWSTLNTRKVQCEGGAKITFKKKSTPPFWQLMSFGWIFIFWTSYLKLFP